MNNLKKRWAFVVNGINICGGINVVFEHAIYAYKHGVEIYILCGAKLKKEQAAWHPETENLIFATFNECEDIIFDVAIATSWVTVYDLYKIKAKTYSYFVQAVESQFMDDKVRKYIPIAELTYTLPLQFITEATWIKEYLFDKYTHSAQLVLNGIRKDLYLNHDEVVEKRDEKKLRVLIEGTVTDWRKNVPLTIDLVNQSEADEVWLLTSSKIDEFEGVDRVFSQILVQDVPKIYRSCDVLVKLSLVEGMYGPPLEMFHCGGTAITFGIPGSEEYIRHGENALVAEVGENEKIVQYINDLKRNPGLLEKLKKGAVKTALEWRGWEESSAEFFVKISQLRETTEDEAKMIMVQSLRLREVFDCLSISGKSEKSEKINRPDPRIEKAWEYAQKHKLKLVVYGAGKLATNAIRKLEEYEAVVSGVAVSSLKGNPKAVFGHEVKEISNYVENQEQYLIWISSNKYFAEISKQLREMKFEHIM